MLGGVGYEVNISLNTYEAISKKEKGLLYTYLHITENSQVLFGFHEQNREGFVFAFNQCIGCGRKYRSNDVIRNAARGNYKGDCKWGCKIIRARLKVSGKNQRKDWCLN